MKIDGTFDLYPTNDRAKKARRAALESLVKNTAHLKKSREYREALIKRNLNKVMQILIRSMTKEIEK